MRSHHRFTSLAACASLVAIACAGSAEAKAPTGPKLTVPRAKLAAAFHCPRPVKNAKKTPMMLVTGTGATGEQAYLIGRDAIDTFGHPSCYVDFPDSTTADIQVSVQYLVWGLRREFALSGRKVGVFGISQGGLLPRMALTYWPDLRNKVSDVLAAAGTQHGTNVGLGSADSCSAANPCTPAAWQQARGSKLLNALNAYPDETPGKVSYTTVRSLTDETVQPQGGKHPTSALRGATNILIQKVCPGRKTTHIGTALDSVTFAAFEDAVAHRGPARVSRLPKNVCDHPFAPGLDEATTNGLLGAAGNLTSGQSAAAPQVKAEPKLRAYVKPRRSKR
jgi:triacylglycerol lipase